MVVGVNKASVCCIIILRVWTLLIDNKFKVGIDSELDEAFGDEQGEVEGSVFEPVSMFLYELLVEVHELELKNLTDKGHDSGESLLVSFGRRY